MSWGSNRSTNNSCSFTLPRLFHLEIHQGRYQAASWHQNAARQTIKLKRFPDWHYCEANFTIADAWLATAMLRRPSSKPQDFGSGLKSVEAGLSHSVGPFQLKDPIVPQDVPDPLKIIFRHMKELVTVMQLAPLLWNAEDEFAVVSWLDARGSALRANLLVIWHERGSAASPRTPLIKDTPFMRRSCCHMLHEHNLPIHERGAAYKTGGREL